MKIVYLNSTVPDVIWMRRYYSSIFPQGERKARRQLKSTERLILDNPEVGRRFGNAREFPISRTPFTMIYRVKANVIEVVRVWDQRRNRADLEL